MSSVGVMHLVDSLAMGGTERVAVNLVNALPRERFRSYLCTTRQAGPLANLVADDVGILHLQRRSTWDLPAIGRLARYLREHEIGILHAHASSIFVANLAAVLKPWPRIIWHDHYGINTQAERSPWIYRLLTRRVSYVLSVSQQLVHWARERLWLPATKVRYVPNFVCEPAAEMPSLELPGKPGSRIVAVANLRPVKDHLTLLRALSLVVRTCPDASLLLVGNTDDAAHVKVIQEEIAKLDLGRQVTLLGPRSDVPAVLSGCEIAVLSSVAEGLPLSLLEYGMAGLPVVCTNVGQCADVLEQGNCGLLVPSQHPQAMAEALLELLASRERRQHFGHAFRQRVRDHYSASAVMRQITQVYENVL